MLLLVVVAVVSTVGYVQTSLALRREATERKRTETARTEAKQAQQTTGAQIEDFKKAFSVCLEAKDYLVKY